MWFTGLTLVRGIFIFIMPGLPILLCMPSKENIGYLLHIMPSTTQGCRMDSLAESLHSFSSIQGNGLLFCHQSIHHGFGFLLAPQKFDGFNDAIIHLGNVGDRLIYFLSTGWLWKLCNLWWNILREPRMALNFLCLTHLKGQFTMPWRTHFKCKEKTQNSP